MLEIINSTTFTTHSFCCIVSIMLPLLEMSFKQKEFDIRTRTTFEEQSPGCYLMDRLLETSENEISDALGEEFYMQ